MGSILQVRCDCGFTSKDLFVGCGMIESPCTVIVACPKCRAIWAMAETRVKRTCRRCGAERIIYNDPANYAPSDIADALKGEAPYLVDVIEAADQAKDDKPVPIMKYRCPGGGRVEMTMEDHGCWD
jgi:hypothetical protein